MKNRIVWKWVWGLALVLVGGSGLLFTICQSSLPDEKKWLVALPRGEWGFGPFWLPSHGSERRKINPFRLGFFGVRLH